MSWDFTHNPNRLPKGCNGRYGQSGYRRHKKAGTKVCARCRASKNHYQREVHRGERYPLRPQPCGTKAAAVRHRSKGEALDLACRVAEAKEIQTRREKVLTPVSKGL